MAKDGKWANIDDVSQAATAAAREILQTRLAKIRELLPLAAQEYQADIEHVHQLRVSCRRASAAEKAFRPLLPAKAKPLRKWLKRIRQAAGPARDTDVLLERIEAEPAETPAHDYVVARLEALREQVQPALVDVAKAAGKGKFEKSIESTLGELDSQSLADRVSFSAFAAEALKAAAKEVFAAAEIRQPTIPQLHQLRIAGKRLRYSIELFHDAFPKSLRQDIYPQLEKIQERLGTLNDHATAQTMFHQWMIELPPNHLAADLAARVVAEHSTAIKLRRDFLKWWKPSRVAELEAKLSVLSS